MARIRIDFNEDGSITMTKSSVAKAVTIMNKEGKLPMDRNELISKLHNRLFVVDRSTEETKESVKDLEIILVKDYDKKPKFCLANVIKSVKFQIKDGRFQGKSPDNVMGKTIEEGLPLVIKYVATNSFINNI